MTPNQFPDLFAVVTLGSSTSPGVVTLSGHNRDLQWDVQAAKGQTGASSQLNGAPVGQFQASFYLATPEQQIAWPAFQRVLETTVHGPTPKALPIYHPDLAVNRFTEVCAASIGGPVRDARGGVTILVKFIEYRPPKPKPSAKAKGGGKGGGAGTGDDGAAGKKSNEPDPNEQRKQELDRLLNEARET